MSGNARNTADNEPRFYSYATRSGEFSQTPSGYTPEMLKRHYSFAAGLSGRGIRVGIVTAYESPYVTEDLLRFSQTFGLPSPVIQTFALRSYPSFVPDDISDRWQIETATDTQWLHAFAPEAEMRLYFSNSDAIGDMLDAANTAGEECDIVSLSFGRREFSGQEQYESMLRDTDTFFVCASGDIGEVMYPSSSPQVLAVGGTKLYLDADGDVIGEELVWENSGCGISRYFQIPEWQRRFYDIDAITGGKRCVPDLSFFASGSVGASVYLSSYGSQSGWTTVSGTSVGTPCVAGVISCAAQKNRSVLGMGPSLFYRLAGGTSYTNPAGVFVDITRGRSGMYSASEGFDIASGLGVINISAFVRSV